MLYQFGFLRIKHQPFNVDKVRSQDSTDFVQKPVLGAAPPNEYVGEGTGTKTLSGTLFPKKLGGLDELRILQMMRESALPHFLLRGDGVPLGWYRITSVTTDEEQLAMDGVGQVTKVQISLIREPAPSGMSLFSFLVRLLS